jgi:hypothetical protein
LSNHSSSARTGQGVWWCIWSEKVFILRGIKKAD